MGLGTVWLQANGGATGGQGLLGLFLFEQKLAKVAVRLRKVGVDVQGPAKIAEGLIDVAKQTVGIAEVVTGQGEIGLQGQGQLKLFNGRGRLILFQKEQTERVGWLSKVRP